MQDVGLEWLYRLAQEPRRLWRRYLVTNTTLALPKIALAVVRLRNYSGKGVARLIRGSVKQ